MFDRVCDNGWTGAVVRDAGVDGDNVLKCKSQALAEQADGDVYFFIPKGVTAIDESAVSKKLFPFISSPRSSERYFDLMLK